MIKGSKFDENVDRHVDSAAFISRVGRLFYTEDFGDLLLCQVMIFPQVSYALKQITHLTSLL